ADIDVFIAVSEYYVPVMAKLLAIPESRIAVVPLGINMNGYRQRPARAGHADFRVGYFARLSPEKGLHFLAQAYRIFRQKTGSVPGRITLDAAGYLGRAQV